MEKTMTITSAQATALFNAIMAKAKEDDSIEVDTHYHTSEDTGRTYIVTAFDAFGKGWSLKSYISITVTFFNDFFTVDISRNNKHGHYWFNVHG